jgi:phage shock protein A
MGLFDRMSRLVRANLNRWVDDFEDPEKMLEQVVLEMQDDLIRLRQAVAQAIATQKRTERQRDQAQTQAEDWHDRARQSMNAGSEDLARQALERRQDCLQTAALYGPQIEQQQMVVQRLKGDLRQIEAKLTEAKAKKDLFIARARSAEASQRINDVLGRSAPGPALDRMEQRVLELEAQSELTAELQRDPLADRFAALEAEQQGQGIEDELNRLRPRRGPELPPM